MQEILGVEKGQEVYTAVQGLFNSGYGYDRDPSRWAERGIVGSYDEFDINRLAHLDTGGYTGV